MELPVPRAGHDGRTARASAPGKFSKLPLSRDKGSPTIKNISDTSSPGAAPLAGKRVLVVEDEFIILLDIQGILETAGASVVAASRLDEALKIVADQADGLDAAVLDLKLDNGSSAPIAERLAAAKIPFVFLTGSPTGSSIAKEHASAPVIGKPFDSAELLAALHQAMSNVTGA